MVRIVDANAIIRYLLNDIPNNAKETYNFMKREKEKAERRKKQIEREQKGEIIEEEKEEEKEEYRMETTRTKMDRKYILQTF